MWCGAVYDSSKIKKPGRPTSARTVIVRGTVYSSAPTDRAIAVFWKSIMNTFVSRREIAWDKIAKIKRGDVVKVKFVKPSKLC